jgi:hypothetical protein
MYLHFHKSRDSSVQRWATGWEIGVLGFDSWRGLGIFLFTTVSRTALGSTQPPNQWVQGPLSWGVKRQGREADHSPPSSAKVKESGSIPPLPQYAFMAWCSVKRSTGKTLPFLTFIYVFT